MNVKANVQVENMAFSEIGINSQNQNGWHNFLNLKRSTENGKISFWIGMGQEMYSGQIKFSEIWTISQKIKMVDRLNK